MLVTSGDQRHKARNLAVSFSGIPIFEKMWKVAMKK